MPLMPLKDDPAIEVVRRHFDLSEDAAAVLVEYMEELTFGSAPVMFDLKRDIEALETLERAINATLAALDLSTWTPAAHDEFGHRLVFGKHADTIRAGGVSIEESDRMVAEERTDALSILERDIAKIRGAIKATKRHIETSRQARKATDRINVTGVQMVACARSVWKMQTGSDAPAKGLNPATPFGRFLADMFAAFELDGDPRAAFRAWVNTY